MMAVRHHERMHWRAVVNHAFWRARQAQADARQTFDDPRAETHRRQYQYWLQQEYANARTEYEAYTVLRRAAIDAGCRARDMP